MSDAAFRGFEDQLRQNDPDEQQRNRDKAQAGPPSMEDPYSPYPALETIGLSGYNTNFAQTNSTAALPLVNRFGGARGYEEEEGDYDNKTFYTEGGEDDYANAPMYEDDRSMGRSDAYAPSRNMFDGQGEKDALRGLEEEEEVVIIQKTSSGRRKWVILTWIFTWWIPSYFLSKCGGMKRSDVRMAWREKVLIK